MNIYIYELRLGEFASGTAVVFANDMVQAGSVLETHLKDFEEYDEQDAPQLFESSWDITDFRDIGPQPDEYIGVMHSTWYIEEY